MRLGTTVLLTFFLVAGSHAFAQQNNPPQRTITTRPDSTAPSDRKPASDVPSSSAAALERYREMWQKMTPAQQNAMVRAGGYTPQQYERMLTQRGAGAAGAQGANPTASPASGHAADSGALDSLSKSMQDLNAIRDANLSLVQKDGCAPELASRIADLKSKLQSYEFELNGPEASAGVAASAQAAEKPGAADAMAVVADWFKRPADPKPAAAAPDGASRTRESILLDRALTGTETVAAPERRIDPKSPDAERQRKVVEAGIASVKSELEQLSGACAAAKK